jgi:hypothetical protein
MADTQFEHWQMWHRECALARCSQRAMSDLESFAGKRMLTFLRRYVTRTNLGSTTLPHLSDPEAWHLFESYMAVTTTRSGKRYKDWLFARTRRDPVSAGDIVEAGASLIMRTVTRDFLRREFSPRATVSMQTVVATGSTGTDLTLEDLLPSPTSPAPTGDGDYEPLAERHATERMAAMNHRDRVALLARSLGLPLSHGAVVAVAGCGKSVLSQAYRLLVTGIGEDVQRAYPDEGEGAMRLALLIIQRLKDHVLLWGKSETRCSALFKAARAQ